MPLNSCTGGLLTAAVLTLLLLPARYLVPELAPPPPLEELAPASEPPAPPARGLALALPALDLVISAALLAAAAFAYLCEWIQRKLMERRIVKLNQYLGASVARLRSWDAQQEHLASALRLVQRAAVEYNLLLCLVLRQRRSPAPAPAPAPAPTPAPAQPCRLDRKLDDPFVLWSPPVEA